MNDDPGQTSAARQQLPPRSEPDQSGESDGEYDAAAEHRDRVPVLPVPAESDSGGRRQPAGSEPSGLSPAAPSQSPSRPRQNEKRREGLVKKLQLVSHLQKSLDMIVFVYICTLYYME